MSYEADQPAIPFWQKDGISSEIKEPLEALHKEFDPKELVDCFDGGFDTGGFDAGKYFAETLATFDISEGDLQKYLPESLTKLSAYIGEVFELTADPEFVATQPKEHQDIINKTVRVTNAFFQDLASRPVSEQVAWAKSVRTKYLEIRADLDAQLEGIQEELEGIYPAKLKGEVNKVTQSMISLSRREWVQVVPHLMDMGLFEASPNEDTNVYLGKMYQRHTILVGFAGMRTFPTEKKEDSAITVIDTDFSYVDGVMDIRFSKDRALSAQRHEALHLSDRLELLEVEGKPSQRIVKMGFRDDIFDVAKKQLVYPREDTPVSAIEEGAAVYFQVGDGKVEDAPWLTGAYIEAYILVKKTIDRMGKDAFFGARMKHDSTEVLRVLREVEGEKGYNRMLELSKDFNKAIIRE